MSLKQKVRDWYKERKDAVANEYDDQVSDLDEYIIEDLLAWALDEEKER